MPIQPTQKTNETQQVEELLRNAFPTAQIDAYRHNSASIRVRIVNSDFQGKSRVEREEEILPILNGLPDEIFSDITLLLLLTPHEVSRSMLNLEFDDPIPSSL